MGFARALWVEAYGSGKTPGCGGMVYGPLQGEYRGRTKEDVSEFELVLAERLPRPTPECGSPVRQIFGSARTERDKPSHEGPFPGCQTAYSPSSFVASSTPSLLAPSVSATCVEPGPTLLVIALSQNGQPSYSIPLHVRVSIFIVLLLSHRRSILPFKVRFASNFLEQLQLPCSPGRLPFKIAPKCAVGPPSLSP